MSRETESGKVCESVIDLQYDKSPGLGALVLHRVASSLPLAVLNGAVQRSAGLSPRWRGQL